ncbi:hypothetical protein I3900191A7_14760 [Clostridium baratii]|uniref:hypothetical protein n=1 Tax=Clostridium baratii TaxID=1561 RepID=UPI0036F1C05C
MNFNDILNNALGLEENIKVMDNIVLKLEECLNLRYNCELNSMQLLLFNDICGGYDPQISNARNLRNSTRNFFEKFKSDLTKINFMEFWIELTKIDEKFNTIIDTAEFKEKMQKDYGIIHSFISEEQNEGNIRVEYSKVLYAIEDIINRVNAITEKINTIKNINLHLNGGIEESDLRIRLLNQDNRLDDTIESLQIMKDMYSSLCTIMDISEEENPIKYTRVESGSFLMNLIGNPVVLSAVGGIITFSYKVYNDHFSTKAKQEKALREIKVRGEYIKLIKELNTTIIQDDTLLKDNLAKLELASIKLYKNSPSINLNGEKIGEETVNVEKIIKFIGETKEIE